jgi:hypothetical protein
VLFGPLGTALDVVGHELTHGITQYTAGLVYAEQPGALNEAFSDIFGALIDDANWEIAESVFTPGIAGDALRSLADPTQYGQPSVWGEYLKLPDTSSTDYGGVHVNSGIINHVAFTIAEQIGREKLGHIFYRTLTMKLISRSDFLDARDAAVQACGELAGTNGITQSDCLKVEWSFAMAGIGGKPSLPEGMRYRLFMPLVTEPTWSCASNLIDNAGFEEQGSWVAWSSVAGAWGLQSEGTRSARLNNTDQMLQLIRLHSGAEHLALSFDTFWDSATGGNQVEISLEDPTTHKPLAPPARVGSELKAGTWQRISIPLQVASGMSTVRLVFKHLVSSGGSGVFYVDNVQLTTKCPTP